MWLKVVTLLAVIGLGFAPEYAGTYADLLGNNITVLSHEETLCDTQGKCRTRYQIKLPADYHSKYKKPTVGIGIIVPSAKAYCENSPNNSSIYGNPESPGETTSETITKYQLFEIHDKDCKSINLDIFAPSEFRRFGHIGGQVLIGDLDSVKRIQKFSDFFLRDFKVICFFILLFFVSLLLVYSNVYSPERGDLFPDNRAYFYWALFLASSSGIVTVLLPREFPPLLLVRTTSLFSILGHVSPVLFSLVSIRRFQKTISSLLLPIPKLRISPLEIGVALLAGSNYFGTSQGPISLVFGLAGVAIGLKFRKFYVTAFSASLLMNAAAFFRTPFAPSFSLTILVVLHYLSYTAITTLLRGRKLMNISFWLKNTLSSENRNESRKRDSILDYLAYTQGSRVTICTVDDGHILIDAFTKSDEGLSHEEIVLNELPPVFAHILSTQSELWHVHVDSPLFSNIYKGESIRSPSSIFGSYFTALPILKESNLVGIISVTGYPDEKVNDEFERLVFENLTKGLIQVIQAFTAVKSDSLKIDRLLAIAEFGRKIGGREYPDLESLSVGIAETSSEVLQSRSIVYHLDKSTQSLCASSFSGYSSEDQDLYRDWKIYTVNQNEQGPAALAVTRQIPVLVPSLKLVESVLHSKTVSVMKKSGIKSVCAIPLSISSVGKDGFAKESVWGILWIESTRSDQFGPSSRREFQHLKEVLKQQSDKVFKAIQHKEIQKKVEGFVPKSVKEKWLKGDSVEEIRRGFLVVSDIRGSTKISKTIGGARWLEFAESLTESIERIASEYGFELASWSWDAFHLLREFGQSEVIGSNTLDEMSEAIEVAVREQIESTFPDLYDDQQAFYTRTCVGSGDISTGLIRGVTTSWGLIGSCMAVVTKLEQAAKAIPGRLFVISDCVSTPSQHWSETKITFAGSTQTVYVSSSSRILTLAVSERTKTRKAA